MADEDNYYYLGNRLEELYNENEVDFDIIPTSGLLTELNEGSGNSVAYEVAVAWFNNHSN